MNFFEKNRFIAWLLIMLVILNVSALGAFLIYFYGKTPASGLQAVRPTHECLRQELSLNQEQTSAVERTLAGVRLIAGPVADSIRSARLDLLDELEKDHPDTIRLKEIRSAIISYQIKLQDIQIEQFLSFKKICTPEQTRELSGFYLKLFGCDQNCRRMGPGEGQQHRHRRGQP